ncbi:ribonuclease P protein component [Mitsuaria sp. GD03876]|nr:ribonuclease P protein component [Mitsuaria sp. GD03876]MDH0867407.1 ribonuclease P protein component [Mitsuaria sp. GD03876]
MRSADFERVLGTPSRARSAHFAVHHLAASPSLPKRRPSTGTAHLSTGDAPIHPQPVDEAVPANVAPTPADLPPAAPDRAWLGYVVPKRHAKRAVTRVLLKRQIRAVFGELPDLPPGLWVVRLRMPFDRKQFPSASSDALRAVARAELLQLTRKLARPQAAAG